MNMVAEFAPTITLKELHPESVMERAEVEAEIQTPDPQKSMRAMYLLGTNLGLEKDYLLTAFYQMDEPELCADFHRCDKGVPREHLEREIGYFQWKIGELEDSKEAISSNGASRSIVKFINEVRDMLVEDLKECVKDSGIEGGADIEKEVSKILSQRKR